MAKDLFSKQSDAYARYRPTYPAELFDHILQFVNQREKAWDCGTGNGQAALVLANYFEKVEATDISEAQLANALKKDNIEYHVCPAEHTPFADNSFDLITVATAYHWFNWEKFHAEVTRVARQHAVIAVWAYNLLSTDDKKINQLIDHLYYAVVAPYWDPERKHVDDSYATVAFDFSPLPSPGFDIRLQWTKQQFIGYLQTWSAIQHFTKQNNTDPLDAIRKDLDQAWNNDEQREIVFPLFLRMGRIG